MIDQPTGDLLSELGVLLNRYSRENASNTPDFILAEYMYRALEAFEWTVRRRDSWYGVSPRPGSILPDAPGDATTFHALDSFNKLLSGRMTQEEYANAPTGTTTEPIHAPGKAGPKCTLCGETRLKHGGMTHGYCAPATPNAKDEMP